MVNANVGDEVSVNLGKKKEKGILLESHEPGIILLKLSSGYNVGIKKKNIKGIKVIRKGKDEEEKEEKIKMKGKPRIDLIITGGTISASLDVKTGGVKWLTSPSKFLNFYPGLLDVVDVKIINPFMKATESMNSSDWIKLGKEVEKSLNDDNVKGVVITQGTDFLHYTAAALSFFLNVNKPVVLTYSQRSIDRGSSDAELNLQCAARAALSDIAEVMIVGHANLNDDFCYALRGNKCRKMHTSRRDTFRPINCKPIAKVWPDKIEVISEYNKKKKGKVNGEFVFEDKVALLKFYPGQDPKILDFYKKYKGLVIEMSGLGHVITEGKKNWIPKLKELIGKGVIICAAPQTLYGRLDPYVYSPGRQLQEAGVLYLEDMLPETALVKLGWVLGKEKNKEKIKEIMLKNISREFNKRLGNEFLE